MSPRMPTPLELGSVTDRVLRITWSDGHRSVYSWVRLRVNCPCAACVGEWRDRRPRLRPEDVRPDIRALGMTRVGAYALRFEWSDGHNTGLYTFASLRHELCECEACARTRGAPASG